MYIGGVQVNLVKSFTPSSGVSKCTCNLCQNSYTCVDRKMNLTTSGLTTCSESTLQMLQSAQHIFWTKQRTWSIALRDNLSPSMQKLLWNRRVIWATTPEAAFMMLNLIELWHTGFLAQTYLTMWWMAVLSWTGATRWIQGIESQAVPIFSVTCFRLGILQPHKCYQFFYVLRYCSVDSFV